jgi:hypothetical protein
MRINSQGFMKKTVLLSSVGERAQIWIRYAAGRRVQALVLL